jgi:endonuclease G
MNKTSKYNKNRQKKMQENKSASANKKITIGSIAVMGLFLLLYAINPDLAKSIVGENTSQGVVSQGFIIHNFEDGYPELPADMNYQIMHHKYYGFAYSPKLKGSYWVAYILTKNMVKTKRVDRSDEEFTKDPLLDENYALSSDYYGSGYDRGHMCPAGDMNFNQTAMTECFYMTNIDPQKAGLNRGIWRELEETVRDWAVENDSLYIVVGAIYSQKPKKIGKNKVAVPSKLFKVVADISQKNGYKAIAFVFKNKDYPDDADFMDYAITVDSLENLTGIDFFANYKNENVEKIEETLNKNLWKN